MSKRFTDTEKFNNPWYRKLPIKYKILWEYLLSECNHAGLLKIDIDLISFKIGETITIDDLKIFENRITFIKDDLIFIPKFIEFQYGALNTENRVHNSVLKELKKYNLQGAIKPLTSPIDGAKDKDKEKDISSSLVLSSSLDEKTEIESGNHSKKFQKPKIEEIQAYCKVRQNNINADEFYDYYESKGWMIGKNKMKNWQAAIRRWERNTRGKTEIESGNRECLQDSTVITAQYAKVAEVAAQNPLDLESVKKKLSFIPKNTKQCITNTLERNKGKDKWKQKNDNINTPEKIF